MITIEHSHAEGTLVHGTDRCDGTNHVIKATEGGELHQPAARTLEHLT